MKYSDQPCRCIDVLPGVRKVILHLMGCPRDYYTREYEEAPWYKRFFMAHPFEFYKYHFRP